MRAAPRRGHNGRPAPLGCPQPNHGRYRHSKGIRASTRPYKVFMTAIDTRFSLAQVRRAAPARPPASPPARPSASPLALACGLLLAGCATVPGSGAPSAGTPAAAPTAAAAPATVSPYPPTPAVLPGTVPGTPPGVTPPVAARPAGAASGAAAVPPVAGQPQPFATVIKDAKQSDGLIAFWQKDEKVWLELKPEDFNKPMFLSPKISHGIGESGLYGGTMVGRWGRWGRSQVIEFVRVHNQVQMRAINTDYLAAAGSPAAHAVKAGFSASLLGSAPVASLPHPERKTVLVEAGPLFLSDMLGLGMTLQRNYRQGYTLDGRHTGFTSVRGKPDQVVFNVNAHFATSTIAVPTPGGPPGAPVPTTPSSLPDARSMFVGLYYAIAKLPEQPMAPRKADPRIGYFSTTVQDFSDDLARSPKQRIVNRWRLEKGDPAAELSEPVKPIVFWLDKTIPMKYRDAFTKGVLAWNPAFEKIGFKNALVVKVQPDDADFDTLDVGVASIRWMTNSQASFGAIGPSQVDPRSGEILDADIGFESLSSRSVRNLRSQVLASRVAVDWPALMQSGPDTGGTPSEQRLAALMTAQHSGDQCQHADVAAEQLGYAMDVLEARGELDPASPEAQQFVLDYLMDTTMHEVGHTLGLRHNFRSSRAYTNAQVADPDFTAKNGLAGSVMEYAPINIGLPGQRHGSPFQTSLGPYDFWAIEYAYKPIAKEAEAAELARIAARSGEPQLAYGTDEDNSLGIDPESLHMDLGDDPVQFATHRIAVARELVARQETRVLKPGEDYSVLRRAVGYAVRDAGRAVGILARQIGGVRTLRDFPNTGRDPLAPVPAEVQRKALDVLAGQVLAASAFKLSPSLQRKLAPDYHERGEALFGGDGPVATDFSVAGMILDMQRALLAQLMSDSVAGRIVDSVGKVDAKVGARVGEKSGGGAFQLSELYSRLTREVWSELGARSGDIDANRRELQREHLNRLTGLLLRPGALSRADARGLMRSEAQALLVRMNAAARRDGLSAEARAHLADSVESLNQALAAKVQRAGI